jgi:acyl-coenzyme A thioesterase PaaI-like protein
VTDALYVPDGDRFVPTPLTTGPWDPGAQHGGAPAGLLTMALERVEAPGPMQVARLTFELMRPVPLAPLRVSTRVLRPGRKVQLAEASLLTGDGTEVVRATALRIRTEAHPVPPEARPDDPVPEGPERGHVLEFPSSRHEGPSFHAVACDIRFVAGGFDRPGPATGWIHLTVPVVAGEETTPMMRLAAASDFGNGLSWSLPRDRWLFINPDLTIHVTRPPEDEWICLRSVTRPGDGGVGLAESAVYDRSGRIGRAVQSLLLDQFASDPP